MNKLLGLRDRILSIANIQQDTITAYASDGHMVGRAPDVFEYAYKAEITITEYNGSADNVLWPVYAWLLDHEPNLRDDQFQFEVDLLDNEGVDILITVPLSERVTRDSVSGAFTHDDPVESADLFGPGITMPGVIAP